MTSQESLVENSRKDRRSGKGRVIALSRRIYRIVNTDVFYVESESTDDMYYYVMFNTAKNFCWCSCRDFENHHRTRNCKHLFAIEFAIKFNTVKDTDKLPVNVKKDNTIPKSYKDDDYSF